MRILFRNIVILAVLATLLVMCGMNVHGQALAPQVRVEVSSVKGSEGAIINIPVYVFVDDRNMPASVSTNHVSFDVTFDQSVLRFEKPVTDDRTALWNTDGILEETTHPVNEHFVFTSTRPIVFEQQKMLLILQFTVIGNKGPVGEVEVKNFLPGDDTNANVTIINGDFRVLPSAIYYNDRDVIEVTSSDIFTGFVIETNAQLSLKIENISGWQFEKKGLLLSGSTKTDGATTVYVPVSPDVENVEIYSIQFDQDEKVRLASRNVFIPFVLR